MILRELYFLAQDFIIKTTLKHKVDSIYNAVLHQNPA